MIDRREILAMAATVSLRPDVIEKDYVLGWLLAGIYNHPAINKNWVFKGGTCLKKCYFETYRFSEDLDFTLTDESQIDKDFLRSVSNHVSYAFARKLEDKDVTVAEWAFMRVLYEKAPLAPSIVAQKMGMTKGAITKLADRLIAKALISREASTDDGRAQTIGLTRKGKKLVPKLAVLADQNDRECFSHLSEKEQKALRDILRKLSTGLGITSVPVK